MTQRKLTAPIAAADLPDLSPYEQEFVRLRLAGKTSADAYRGAYSASNMGDKAIWVEASRVSSRPNVALWLAAAREAHLGTAVLTRDAHLAELERLREIALKSGNIGAAVQAEQLRGKVAGHQVDRVMDLTQTDATETLKAIEKHAPDLAAQLAAAHGIEWKPAEGATKH